MKTLTRFSRITLAAFSTIGTLTAPTLLGVPASFAQAQTSGTTVDSFQLVAGSPSTGNGVATNSLGHVFTVGRAKVNNESTGQYYWVVRRSVDGGNTFSTTMTYSFGLLTNSANAIAVDASDNIYVVGQGQDSKGSVRWNVRKSSDGGANWQLVDAPLATGIGTNEIAYGICVSASGAIYVVGQGGSTTKRDAQHWLVRRSTDGGATWTTVDSYQLASTHLAVASSIAEDAAGNLYVGGWAGDSSDVRHWIVRKKAASSSTWTTIDNFQYVPGQQLTATGIAVDNASGSVFVTGWAMDSGSRTHALLRRVSTSGGSFTTVNDFLRDGTRSALSNALMIGPSGELIQAVYAGTGNGWMIRSSYDGGATFSILDQYVATAGTTNNPKGLAKFGGTIFAVGSSDDSLTATPTTGQYWLTRKY